MRTVQVGQRGIFFHFLTVGVFTAAQIDLQLQLLNRESTIL